MALSRLGDFIELVDVRNQDEIFTEKDVRGISTSKAFIKTKADLNGVSLKNYKIVNVNQFAYVADTSRRGEKIGLAFADQCPCIISSIYTVFKVRDESKLLSRYLMMFFSRAEFDRYARFNSWGSARETFTWEDMCDILIEIPSVEIQKKYVDIYEGLLSNLNTYINRLNNLKLSIDAQIQKIYKSNERYKMEDFVVRRTEKNINFAVKKLIGVGKDGFIEPKQKKDETNGHICYLVKKNDFVFAPPQIHSGSIDLHINDEVVKCSDAYIVFYLINDRLNPYYLFAILKSPFFQKYAYYYRDGVREQFDFEQLKEYEIPVPNKETQNAIAELFKSLSTYSKFIETLKQKISSICPILIRGAVKEAKGGN